MRGLYGAHRGSTREADSAGLSRPCRIDIRFMPVSVLRLLHGVEAECVVPVAPPRLALIRFTEDNMTLKSLAETGLRLANGIPHSLVALTARLAVGGVFWRSAQTKVEGFHIKDSTFFLFREEYKLPLLPPDLAAYMATTFEHLFSVLLLIGLASRLSAAGLLFMTAVIQIFVYPDGWPDHILWATALLLILARGPGAVSLDHLLFRRPFANPAYAR
jgi:putative oxidoreductase